METKVKGCELNSKTAAHQHQNSNISETAPNTLPISSPTNIAREIILDSLIKGNQFNT